MEKETRARFISKVKLNKNELGLELPVNNIQTLNLRISSEDSASVLFYLPH